MGTEGAGTEDDRAVAEELVADLLRTVRDSGRTISALAEQVDISRSSVSRWKTGTIPRIFNAQLIGAAAGLRMEWAPNDSRWPGAERPRRAGPPAALKMMERPPGSELQMPNEKASDWYSAMLDAHLLGGEARWARIYIRSWSLDECPGDRHAWSAFEHGPEVQPPGASAGKRRRHQSAPLPTAVFIGRHLGLKLVWSKRSDLYRLRPWEVQIPPPPNSSTAALREARHQRPRLW